MKWVFGLIVLANIALFMWGRWYHEPLVATELPQPQSDVAAEKMKLLSEPGVRLTPRGGEGAASSAAMVTATPGCYRLGPFATLDNARAAGTKLDAWNVEHTRVAEFETFGPAYRVYLPPRPSREAAEQDRRALTKLGFNDHALIQQEKGMENAISLGIFAIEENARTRAEQLGRQGVRAAVQLIPNIQPVYWLALTRLAVDGRLGDTPLKTFREEDWGAEVQLTPALCGIERAVR